MKLSKLSDAGTAVIVQENLKLSDDGNYVILPLSAGFEDTDIVYGGKYYISSGGEKLFEYPLDVEMEPQMTSDIVTKEKNFKVNVTVVNNNDNNVQDVAIFPSLMKTVDGEMIEGLDWTCTVEEGKAVITPDGVYVESMTKGEAVRLSFAMSIAETVAEERIDLYMHASSLDANDELVDYGDDYIRLRLADASLRLKGDINQDGIIDASNLMYMLQVVSERIGAADLSTEQIQAGDVAGADGKITADDLMKMLQFVSERITTLD